MPSDLPAPTDLPKGFREPEVIGRGGFAVVYRAVQPALHRTVAVKVLQEDLDERGRRRFTQEVGAMGALSGHPHIAQVHEAGFTDGGRAYIVMPFLPGGSLGDRVRSRGSMGWADVVSIGVKMAGALASAHAVGVLHRDIKPDNVLLDAFGEPVLADFGIAAAIGSKATRTGEFTASLAYAPPEVLEGARPDERSDLYSLGATMHCLLAGRPPFHSDDDVTVGALISRILRADAPPIDDIPADLAAVLGTAQDKDNDARMPSAAALGESLRAVQRAHGLPVTRLRIAEPPARRPVVPSRAGDPAPGTDTAPSGVDRSGGGLPAGSAEATVARAVAELEPRQEDGLQDAVPPRRRGRPVLVLAVGAVLLLATAAAAVLLTSRSAPVGAPVADLGLAGRIFGAQIEDPDALADAQGEVDDLVGTGRSLGAWWALADWCAVEGFTRPGQCYDLAAEYLVGIGGEEPRELDVTDDLDRGSLGESLRGGYRLGQEALDLLVDIPAEQDLVAGRPGTGITCDPDCDAVADELIVVGADFMEEETDAGPEPGATSSSSSSSPSEDDEPVEDTEVPTPEPTDPVRVATLFDDNATLRTTPQITESNIVGRIQDQEGAAVEVLGGGQDGWYEIRAANGAEGWIWGAFLLPGVDDLLPALTGDGQEPTLRDQFGTPLGIENPSGDKVLTMDRRGDLWMVLLPDATVAYVEPGEVRLP